MTGIELVVGYLAAWGVRKLRWADAAVEVEADRVIDAALEKVHEVVAGKLGGDPAWAKLEAAPQAVSERVGRRVEDAVADAAEDDPGFAAALAEALAAVRTAEQATGVSAAGRRSWSLGRVQSVLTPLTGHTGPVEAVATAALPGDRLVAVTDSHDHTVRVWDPAGAVRWGTRCMLWGRSMGLPCGVWLVRLLFLVARVASPGLTCGGFDRGGWVGGGAWGCAAAVGPSPDGSAVVVGGGGLERAAGRRLAAPELDVAFYGDLFLAPVTGHRPPGWRTWMPRRSPIWCRRG